MWPLWKGDVPVEIIPHSVLELRPVLSRRGGNACKSAGMKTPLTLIGLATVLPMEVLIAWFISKLAPSTKVQIRNDLQLRVSELSFSLLLHGTIRASRMTEREIGRP
jgi:hypothetical protein